MIQELSRKYPKLAFDRVDLNLDEAIALPLRGKTSRTSCRKPSSSATASSQWLRWPPANRPAYRSPSPTTGIAPGAHLKLGQPDECWWTCSATIRPTTPSSAAHGASRAAGAPFITTCWCRRQRRIVDAVGAAIMGFEPTRVAHLALAQRRGFGVADLGPIWTRGNEIEQARRS